LNTFLNSTAAMGGASEAVNESGAAEQAARRAWI
jgi:hypothetical protein